MMTVRVLLAERPSVSVATWLVSNSQGKFLVVIHKRPRRRSEVTASLGETNGRQNLRAMRVLELYEGLVGLGAEEIGLRTRRAGAALRESEAMVVEILLQLKYLRVCGAIPQILSEYVG